MKSVLFFVLLVLSFCEADAQNLAVNPGMEDWQTALKPTGWSASEGCTMESTVRNSGVYSCMQNGGGTGTASKELNQTIAVQPGKDYSFSVYFRTGTATTGNGGRIWCKWLNAGVDVTDAASETIMQTTYLKSATWQQYLFTVKSPPTATTFLLQVRTLSNSVTYWDDFVFQEGLATGVNNDIKASPEIYPVPAGDYLNIKNVTGIGSLEVLDLSGMVVKSVTTSSDSETSIYVGELAKGFYIIRMRYRDRVEVRKFLKN